MGWLACRRHDGSADSHGGWRTCGIDVALADSEHLADARRGSKHDLDDLLQLSVRGRTWHTGTTTPPTHGCADGIDLRGRQGHRLRGRLLEPGGVAHRILLQRVIAHRKPEREAKHGARLLGGAVALPGRERLDELIDLAHGDLTQDEVLEGGQHELAHVPLVQSSSTGCEFALEIKVLQPDLDKVPERAATRQLTPTEALLGALGEQGLESTSRSLLADPSGLHTPQLAIMITETSERTEPSAWGPLVVDLAERPDRRARPNHG